MTKRGSLLEVMRCPRVSKLPHTLTQDHPTARVKWMQCKNVKREHRGRSIKVLHKEENKDTKLQALKTIHNCQKQEKEGKMSVKIIKQET